MRINLSALLSKFGSVAKVLAVRAWSLFVKELAHYGPEVLKWLADHVGPAVRMAEEMFPIPAGATEAEKKEINAKRRNAVIESIRKAAIADGKVIGESLIRKYIEDALTNGKLVVPFDLDGETIPDPKPIAAAKPKK